MQAQQQNRFVQTAAQLDGLKGNQIPQFYAPSLAETEDRMPQQRPTNNIVFMRYYKDPQCNDESTDRFTYSDGKKSLQGPAGLIVPCYIVDTPDLAIINGPGRASLNAYAKFGICMHPSPLLVHSLRSGGKGSVRSALKVLTAHNQKLGFNWSTMPNKHGYKPLTDESLSRLPSNSSYVAWLTTAQQTNPSPDMQAHYLRLINGYKNSKTTIADIQRIQLEQVPTTGIFGVDNLYARGDETISEIDNMSMLAGEDELWGPNPKRLRPDDYRQRFDVDNFEDNRGNRGITVGNLHSAMVTLPEIMAAVAKEIEGVPDRDYALSVISPFHAASKGTRIPNLQPIQTVTGTNFQDLGTFSITGPAALLVTNFTCFNTAPWVLLQGITQAQLDAQPTQAQGWFWPTAPGLQVQNFNLNIDAPLEYTIRLVDISNTFVNNVNNEIVPGALTFGVSPGVAGLFSSVRVAAGGYRIFKTSASTTESGIIKAYYCDRGAYVARNIAQLLNYFQDDASHIRIYCAGGAGEAMGRAGYMYGAIYQPIDVLETQEFTDSARIILGDSGVSQNGQFLTAPQLGPLQLFIKVPIQIQIPAIGRLYTQNKWYLMDTLCYQYIISGELEVSALGINVDSFQTRHMTVQSFEGVQTDTTFEFQWVVHYEGIPSSESQYLETEMCVLSSQYATALDILRRFDFADFRTGLNLNIDSASSELIQGIFQKGFFQKAGSAFHKGVEAIKRDRNLRDKLLRLSAPIARALLSKLPGGSVIAPMVTNAIEGKLHETERDTAGSDIVQQYRQCNYEARRNLG